jgi:hypothetical protein
MVMVVCHVVMARVRGMHDSGMRDAGVREIPHAHATVAANHGDMGAGRPSDTRKQRSGKAG